MNSYPRTLQVELILAVAGRFLTAPSPLIGASYPLTVELGLISEAELTPTEQFTLTRQSWNALSIGFTDLLSGTYLEPSDPVLRNLADRIRGGGAANEVVEYINGRVASGDGYCDTSLTIPALLYGRLHVVCIENANSLTAVEEFINARVAVIIDTYNKTTDGYEVVLHDFRVDANPARTAILTGALNGPV